MKTIHVGKCTSPMDGMGYVFLALFSKMFKAILGILFEKKHTHTQTKPFISPNLRASKSFESGDFGLQKTAKDTKYTTFGNYSLWLGLSPLPETVANEGLVRDPLLKM